MTVEERAQLMLDDYLKWTASPLEGKEELKARYVQHLCDQIEDCAKVADIEAEGASSYDWKHAAETIAEEIRARSEKGE